MDSQISADFPGKIIINLGVPGNGGMLLLCGIVPPRMPSPFPPQYTPLAPQRPHQFLALPAYQRHFFVVLLGYAKDYGYATNFAERPGVLMIDVMEAHLHPAAQQRIIPTSQRHFSKLPLFCSTR